MTTVRVVGGPGNGRYIPNVGRLMRMPWPQVTTTAYVDRAVSPQNVTESFRVAEYALTRDDHGELVYVFVR